MILLDLRRRKIPNSLYVLFLGVAILILPPLAGIPEGDSLNTLKEIGDILAKGSAAILLRDASRRS